MSHDNQNIVILDLNQDVNKQLADFLKNKNDPKYTVEKHIKDQTKF